MIADPRRETPIPTPPMEEPTWPGAPVIAACSGDNRERLHVRHNDGPHSEWECRYCCYSADWRDLGNPRPLTPAEHEKYGIPMPCTHAADDETVHRLQAEQIADWIEEN